MALPYRPLRPSQSNRCTVHEIVVSLALIFIVTFTIAIVLTQVHHPSRSSPRRKPSALSDVYHSELFMQSYSEMEKNFKVYIYENGDTPREVTGKYSSEDYFFVNIRESRFITKNSDEADLFFIPISCHKMRTEGASYLNMTTIIQNYVESLIAKYPYWNQTLGADHFFVTCHDVSVNATEGHHFLAKNAIHVVCSPSYASGYIPHKDVALPQVKLPFALPAGGNDIKNRTILGFWAGHENSKIRVMLSRLWTNDNELDISSSRIYNGAAHLAYLNRFYMSKFCICAGGSQVNSPRIADSIHYGCVPVKHLNVLCSFPSLLITCCLSKIGKIILSDYYDLPFNDVLNWYKFAVILREHDVYQLKQLLKNIKNEEFVILHNNLVEVQKHFQWHSPPIKYDAFHTVMYELWLRRHVIKY